MNSREQTPPPDLDLSLFHGGPLYALGCRLGMPPDEPRGAARLAMAILAVTWVPIVVLAAMQGQALAGSTREPLLTDPAVWARLVIGLPALIIFGPMIAARTSPAMVQLGHLVPNKRQAEFERLRRSVARVAQSWLPEIALLGLSVFTGWLAFHSAAPGEYEDWRTLAGGLPSLAGRWAAAVSLPLFQFVVLRWLWRIVLWWWFLIGVTRLKLELRPTHPDGFGGLGFLGESQSAFFLLASPLALIFSTYVAKAVLHGQSMHGFQGPAVAFVVLCAIVLIGPAMSVTGELVRVRRRGIFEFGRLGQSYVSQFDGKWNRGELPSEPLLGSADIQSLADIANSMNVIRGMRPVPFERRHLMLFMACIALPAIPPLLLVLPLKEILGRVASILAK